MTKVQEADWQAYSVLAVFLKENEDTYANNPLVAEDVAVFQDLFAQFKSKKDDVESVATHTAADKAKLKESLATTAALIFKYLQSQGVRKNDETLKTMKKPAKSAMLVLTDADFSKLMTDIADKVKTYSEVLTQFTLPPKNKPLSSPMWTLLTM